MKIVCLAVLAGAAATSLAGVDTQTQNWGFPLSPNTATLTFNKFDDAGGTKVLTKVEMLFNAGMGANVTAENDSTLPAPDFAVNLSGFVTVSFASLSGFAGLSQSAAAGVDATDGVADSGPDFNDFGYLSDSDSGSDDTTSGLAAYYGPGTINADVFGSGGFSVSGTTDSTLQLSNFMGSGDVTINYYWDPIPAPGSLGLAAAGLVLAGRRRR
ncbi:MAG TPA: choice-of-anchor E domain-containing protein [Phycisphaerales bacterium]|nr:choice-of-anchor E domain-containing protein [Phycisphaerales bacterium]